MLFTAGMSDDKQIIITDAPKQAIEEWCYRYCEAIENGKSIEPYDTLKTQYYLKELHDSDTDDNEKIESIGYDEVFYIFDYYTE